MQRDSNRVDYWNVADGTSTTFGMNEEVTAEQVLQNASKFDIKLDISDLMKFEEVDTVEQFIHKLVVKGMEQLVRDYMFKQVWNSLNYNYDKKEELFRANAFQANDIRELKREIAALKGEGGSNWS